MPVCLSCGSEISRRHRNFFEKAAVRAVFTCDHCHRRSYIQRAWFAIFHPYAECPRCGTRELSRLKSRDRIDAITRNPLRRMLALVGAPLYHCTFCRFQFRDWRELKAVEKSAPTLQ